MPSLFRPTLFAALCLVASWGVGMGADTTLNVKSSYDVGEPIEISVTAQAGAKVTWNFSAGLITKDAQADGLRLWGWAKPGKQTVKATVVVVKTRKVTVFVPDPAFPNDVTKAKIGTLDVFESYSSEVLADEFIQKGGIDPDPTPIPPGPDPPKPDPPIPPVVAGPRTIILLRESAEDTPSMGRLINSLQAGKAREYLRSKGHSCFVLDDDAVNSAGQPSELVAKWKAFLDVPLPAVAILDDKQNVLFKISLAEGTTADDVISWLKSKGG